MLNPLIIWVHLFLFGIPYSNRSPYAVHMEKFLTPVRTCWWHAVHGARSQTYAEATNAAGTFGRFQYRVNDVCGLFPIIWKTGVNLGFWSKVIKCFAYHRLAACYLTRQSMRNLLGWRYAQVTLPLFMTSSVGTVNSFQTDRPDRQTENFTVSSVALLAAERDWGCREESEGPARRPRCSAVHSS